MPLVAYIVYDEDREKAEQYLSEGWQSEVLMPEMPKESPWPALKILLDAESDIRLGRVVQANMDEIDPYWADLIRILQIYSYTLVPQNEAKRLLVKSLKERMSTDVYSIYIDKREASQRDKIARDEVSVQLDWVTNAVENPE